VALLAVADKGHAVLTSVGHFIIGVTISTPVATELLCIIIGVATLAAGNLF